jgi:hypothetical protein
VTGRPVLDEPVIISRWWKNRGGEEIRLELSTFEGHNIVNLRTWFTAADGTMRPGKGFACSARHLARLADVFDQALTKARDLGLIEAADATEGANHG